MSIGNSIRIQAGRHDNASVPDESDAAAMSAKSGKIIINNTGMTQTRRMGRLHNSDKDAYNTAKAVPPYPARRITSDATH
jgi:hypothetical protein